MFVRAYEPREIEITESEVDRITIKRLKDLLDLNINRSEGTLYIDHQDMLICVRDRDGSKDYIREATQLDFTVLNLIDEIEQRAKKREPQRFNRIR